MSEQEYITAQELTLVREAIATLQKIIPDNSAVVNQTDKVEVMEKLYGWEERLAKLIEISDVQISW